MTLRLVHPNAQRTRIETQEHYALERKLAARRLKEELAPRIRWWKLKRMALRTAQRIGEFFER